MLLVAVAAVGTLRVAAMEPSNAGGIIVSTGWRCVALGLWWIMSGSDILNLCYFFGFKTLDFTKKLASTFEIEEIEEKTWSKRPDSTNFRKNNGMKLSSVEESSDELWMKSKFYP